MAKSRISIDVEADTDLMVKKLQAISKHTDKLASELLSIDQEKRLDFIEWVKGVPLKDCSTEELFNELKTREDVAYVEQENIHGVSIDFRCADAKIFNVVKNIYKGNDPTA